MKTQAKPAERVPLLPLLFAWLAALLVAHDIDHILNEPQLGELSAAFWVFFGLQIATYAAVGVLLARSKRIAPLAVGAVASLAVIALAVGHLTPFGPLPYADVEPAAIDWALLFVPLAFAVITLLAAGRSRIA